MLSYCSGLSMSPSVACLEAFKGQHLSMISSRINMSISDGAGRRCCGGKHAALGWDSWCPDIKMFTPNRSLIQPRRWRCLGIANRTVKACKQIQTNENAEISQPGRHCIGCIFTNGPTVRFLLFCSAASCIIWSLQHNAAALAADASLLPNTVRNAKSILHSAWPKTLQVLNVFKDQGLLLAVLLGLSAFFSMAETSITTLWPWKVRELAEKEGEDGVFQLLRRDITRFLTTILIGTTVANIAATALVTEAATSLFGEAGVTAATGVMTVIVLLLTEITPKSIAVHNATEVARFVVRPVAWLSVVLYPVGRLVTVLSMGMLKILGIKSSREPFVTEEELKLMLRGAELSGAIEEEEQDMIENVLEIKDTFVREVMTPLVDVVAIDAEATLMDFRNTWVKHQYSRIPVFERRVDNIVGIAYAMDMLDYIEQAELLQRLTVGRIAHRPAFFVPDSMSVWNLLREFRIRKVHMAIVLNEYGGTIGVVTLEDVVEEIVGEIFDENDSKEEILKKTGYVVQRADGVFDVDANTSIEDLADTLEVKVPAGPYYYETVSGFVCEAFGYIPRTGERVTVTLRKADIDGSTDRDGDIDQQEDRKEKFQKYRLEILAGNARKISSVRFELVDGLQNKEQTSPRALPRILKRGWEKRHGTIEELNVETELDPSCTWKANNIEQNINHRDLCKSEDDSVTRNDTVGASQVYDVSIIPANKSMEFQVGKVGIPSDIVHADIEIVDTETVSNTNWEDYEKKVERRREERRKLSAEAAEELDRQRQADIRRREADIERATSSSRRARAEEDADD